MLNGVFRIGVVNRSQQPQQQKHHAPPLLAKQHPVIKESDSNTPTRRALAPVSGNQVNAMQRIRNFVSGPLSQPSFVVASDVPQLTASAKKVASILLDPSLCHRIKSFLHALSPLAYIHPSTLPLCFTRALNVNADSFLEAEGVQFRQKRASATSRAGLFSMCPFAIVCLS
jgi:hypothetical protein